MSSTSLALERADHVAAILDTAAQLHLPEVLERHLGSHGLHRGISNGWLATVWIACMLSEQEHRKSGVRAWAERHGHLLERRLPQPLRPVEFSDGRLGIVLRRFTQTTTWEALEAELWQCAHRKTGERVTGVRLETTTIPGSCPPGRETDAEAYLRLTLATAHRSGRVLACEISPHPSSAAGARALVRRVRSLLGRSGLLFVGGGELAALETRAEIVAQGDHYLVSLPADAPLGEGSELRRRHLARPIDSDGQALGVGYEFGQPLEAELAARRVSWTERVQEVRSPSLMCREWEEMEARLTKAEQALRALTPPPGRGRRQFQDEAMLGAAVTRVLEQFGVAGLLDVCWHREEKTVVRYIGRGRGGPMRPTCRETRVCLAIQEVKRREASIQQARERLGWRAQATSLPAQVLPLAEAVAYCQDDEGAGRGPSLLRDTPLQKALQHVRREDQLVGLGRLLMVALWLRPWVHHSPPDRAPWADPPLHLAEAGRTATRYDERKTGILDPVGARSV
jgi:hypothetical protein